MPLRLHKLNLTQFRSYEALRLDTGGAPAVVLTGPNGAGKTNILEAISLLIPGRGLRGADLLEMKNRRAGPDEPWAVAAEVETATGMMVRLGTGLDRDAKRRVVRIEGRDSKGHNALSEYVACLWLTPQMDRLFIEGASMRRKFFDRLVFAYAPAHVTELNTYDKNLRERMKLLQDIRPDPRWLDTLETQLAAGAVSIGAARLHLLERLAQYAAQLKSRQSLFPAPETVMEGWTEQALLNRPAVDVEEELKARFRASRMADAAAGKSLEGIHRSDFAVRYAAKDMPAAQCSTGEQKGLLVALVLAHALMMRGEKGFVPLLLLDEVAAHLDDARREELLSTLEALDGQLFLTGTDAAMFGRLQRTAAFFTVDHAQVTRTREPA